MEYMGRYIPDHIRISRGEIKERSGKKNQDKEERAEGKKSAQGGGKR